MPPRRASSATTVSTRRSRRVQRVPMTQPVWKTPSETDRGQRGSYKDFYIEELKMAKNLRLLPDNNVSLKTLEIRANLLNKLSEALGRLSLKDLLSHERLSNVFNSIVASTDSVHSKKTLWESMWVLSKLGFTDDETQTWVQQESKAAKGKSRKKQKSGTPSKRISEGRISLSKWYDKFKTMRNEHGDKKMTWAFMIYCLYVLFPPRRVKDYRTMRLTHDTRVSETKTGNWLLISGTSDDPSVSMHFYDTKTSSAEGRPHAFSLDSNPPPQLYNKLKSAPYNFLFDLPELKSYILKYIVDHKIEDGMYLFSKARDKFKEPTDSNFTRDISKIYSKQTPLTNTDMRHLVEHRAQQTNEDDTDVHIWVADRMDHDEQTADESYRLTNDNEREVERNAVSPDQSFMGNINANIDENIDDNIDESIGDMGAISGPSQANVRHVDFDNFVEIMTDTCSAQMKALAIVRGNPEAYKHIEVFKAELGL